MTTPALTHSEPALTPYPIPDRPGVWSLRGQDGWRAGWDSVQQLREDVRAALPALFPGRPVVCRVVTSYLQVNRGERCAKRGDYVPPVYRERHGVEIEERL